MKTLSPDRIICIVARNSNVTVAAIKGRSKFQPLATTRQMAMALTRELTSLSTPEIGKIFERDHGTIIHATKAVKDGCETDKEYLARYNFLKVKLTSNEAQKN